MKTKIKASRRSMGMNYAIREVTVPAAAAAKAGKKLLDLNIGDPNKWDFETPEYEKHGAVITPQDVYVTAGVSECINVMMGTLIEPGDEILVPGPGYPSYAQYINFYEGRTVSYRQIEEEDWRSTPT